MKSLSPCLECQRHVRSGDAQCPFCGAARSALPAVSAEASPLRISKRAAAIAMSVSLAAAACDDTNAVAIYGAPGPPPSVGGSGGAAGAPGNGGSSGGSSLPEAPADAGADAADAALT